MTRWGESIPLSALLLSLSQTQTHALQQWQLHECPCWSALVVVAPLTEG